MKKNSETKYFLNLNLMKKLLLLIASLSLSFFTLIVYAAEVTVAPSMKANSNTSITVQWNSDPDALGYYVHYDTASGEASWYRNEVPDLIEDAEYTIEWLKPSTQYFIAISAVDIDGEESDVSPEVALFTTGEATSQAFALEGVEATWIQELTLTFNSQLEDTQDAEREFLIINSQTDEEIFVEDTELDQEETNKLILSLDRELVLSGSYDFTILSIIDVNGRNIESGIDALTNFQVPESFVEESVEPEVIVELPDQEELPEPELNAAPPTESLDGGNAGQIVSGNSLEKDTTQTAESSDQLPQTWPEHVLLFLLAFMVGGIILFSFTQKRKS